MLRNSNSFQSNCWIRLLDILNVEVLSYRRSKIWRKASRTTFLRRHSSSSHYISRLLKYRFQCITKFFPWTILVFRSPLKFSILHIVSIITHYNPRSQLSPSRINSQDNLPLLIIPAIHQRIQPSCQPIRRLTHLNLYNRVRTSKVSASLQIRRAEVLTVHVITIPDIGINSPLHSAGDRRRGISAGNPFRSWSEEIVFLDAFGKSGEVRCDGLVGEGSHVSA